MLNKRFPNSLHTQFALRPMIGRPGNHRAMVSNHSSPMQIHDTHTKLNVSKF